ncbi:lipoprotein yfgL [Candidatus Photodesmus blepharus]|uniref:Outer membrane protein assembly factor BamB n=1 Tax=Candidatus Photodesmus blepharonis TaxID=1179155 RepID=A0A084CPF5_9GAMM|nr:outer membrane protein assembly factor BamB [Candidatus Photodesmus blepharus]KEY91684.1 lipoprotein yfgL [Candidatus Photodesmus blepharus]
MRKLFSNELIFVVFLQVIVGCAGTEGTFVPKVQSSFIPIEEWTVSVGQGVGHHFSKLTPKYAYGKIYVASRSGLIKALNPEDGATLWENNLERDISARLSGGISAAYSKLFIGTENGQLIALDVECGKLIWFTDVGGEVLSSPVTDSNMVIVNTNRGALVALEQDSGKKKWTVQTDVPSLTLRGDSTPVAIWGTVFWGTADGYLAAATLEQGELIWRKIVSLPQGGTEISRLVDVDSLPLVLGNNLFAVGINGKLVAVDLYSGQLIWKRTYSSAIDLVSDGSRIFIVTDIDRLVAVDPQSGAEIWKNHQLSNRLLTSPKIINGYLVVGDNEGYLHWIDRKNGELIAQQMVDDSGFAVGPIEIPGGYVLITRNGNLKKLAIN